MSELIRCPMCGKQATWLGCIGCGDDLGTSVCKNCGATIPGASLGQCKEAEAEIEGESNDG